jgi:hypothetical protein
MRAVLEPVLARRGDPVQVERQRRLLLGPQPRPAAPAALAAVAQLLERDPDATSAAVCAAVPLRRQMVLDALRELRGPGNRFPYAQREREPDGRVPLIDMEGGELHA